MAENIKQQGLAVAFTLATVFGAQAASATPLSLTSGDTITLGYGGTAQGDPYYGGGFLATGVSVANGSSGSFITFCLEYTEEFYLNGTYHVNLSTGAVNGGISNAGTYTGDVNGVTNFDPLSNATAWLYTQYRNGALFSNASPNVYADQTALQLAIWALEGELSSAVNGSASALIDYNSNSLAQGWVNAAVGAAQGGWTNPGDVMVMQMWSSYSNGVFSGNAQDQIYMSPIPEPETYAMMLAGLGLLGFVARRRKQKAA